MKIKKYVSTCCALSLFAAGCAPASKNISPEYVSPMAYQGYTCNQVREEMQRVTRRVHEVAGVQDSHAQKDAAALGVGLILFWPALFFMIGQDKKEELARLKGEYEALEQTAIKKNCNVAKEIEEARSLEEEREEKAAPVRETKEVNE